MTSPRIVLADDDNLTRGALAELLLEEPGFGGISSCATSEQLRDALLAGCDLVLLADTLDREHTASLCREISETTAVLILARGDVETVLLPALEAGALGVVPATVAYPELVQTVRAALRGEACVPRGMLGSLLRGLIDRRRRDDQATARYGRLTSREREVLQLLARGSDLDGMAASLFVSPQTVRSHLQHVLEKLEVHSRGEAVSFLLDHDLVDPATPGSSS